MPKTLVIMTRMLRSIKMHALANPIRISEVFSSMFSVQKPNFDSDVILPANMTVNFTLQETRPFDELRDDVFHI